MRAARVVAIVAVVCWSVLATLRRASAGRDRGCARRAPARRRRQQRAHPEWGQAGRALPAHRARQLRRRGRARRSAARRPATSATGSSTTARRTCSPRTRVTQWGFVWGQFIDHTFGLREETGGEPAPIAFDAHRPAGGVPQRLRRDRLHAHARGARHGRRRRRRASRSTPSRATSTARPSTATTPSGWRGCATARKLQLDAGRPAAAPRDRATPTAPAMALHGPPDRPAARRRWSPATCARTRTSR